MSYKINIDRDHVLEDYEPLEISGIDDLIFEYEKDRDLESELSPYIDLNYN